MDDLNAAVQAFAGEWVRLTKKTDGIVEGRVMHWEPRAASYQGRPTVNQKTGAQRYEWVFTVLPDDATEPVKFSIMETGQRTIGKAITDAGGNAKIGDRIKIAVTKDSIQGEAQAEYKVLWTPDNAPLNIPNPDADESEPF